MKHPIATRLISLTMALLMVLAIPASALEGVAPAEESTVTYDAYGNEISTSEESQQDPFDVTEGESTEVLSVETEPEEGLVEDQEELVEEPVYIQDGKYLAPEKLVLQVAQWLDDDKKENQSIEDYTGIVAFYDYNEESQKKMLEEPYYFYYEDGELQKEETLHITADRVMSAERAPGAEQVKDETLPAYEVKESYVDPEAEEHPELLFVFNDEDKDVENGLYTGDYEDVTYQDGLAQVQEENTSEEQPAAVEEGSASEEQPAASEEGSTSEEQPAAEAGELVPAPEQVETQTVTPEEESQPAGEMSEDEAAVPEEETAAPVQDGENQVVAPAEETVAAEEAADSTSYPQLNLETELTVDGVKLTWNGDNGAAKGYRVMVNGSVAAELPAGVSQWVHENAASGQQYTYTVRAYYGDQGTSNREEESASVWGPAVSKNNVLYLAAPAVTRKVGSTNAIAIQWSSVSGAQSYRIYRKPTSGGDWTAVATVTGTSYTDKSSAMTSGKRYYYTVQAISGSTAGAYTDTSNDFNNSVAILTVPQVSVKGGSGITVSWKKDNAATGYKVYRKKSGQKGWTMVAEISKNSTVSYKDKGITSAGKYAYTVRAHYGNGVWSGYKASAWVTFQANIPVLGNVYSQADGMKVTWKPVSGAVGYVVYRKGKTSGYAKLARVNGQKTASYLDKKVSADGVYAYTVRAVFKNSNGKEYMGGYYSPAGYETFHAAPSVKGSISNGNVTLSWTVDSKAAGYRVYRKLDNGKLRVVKNYTKEELAGQSTIRFTDDNVSAVKLAYSVRAYYGSKVIGKASVDNSNDWGATGVCKLNTLTAPKLGRSASNQNDGIKVTWEKVAGAAGYIVYRKPSGGKWSRVANINNGATQTYTDQKNLKAGTTYYYTVRAIDDEGTYGGYDSAGMPVVYLPAPQLEKVTEGSKGLTVRWSKISNADGYMIYRKTKNGYWKLIETVSANTTSYLDTKATGDAANYTYTVKAYKKGQLNDGTDYTFQGSYDRKGTSVGIRMSGSGWVIKNKQTYYVKDGFALTGWQYLQRNGSTYKYYFDEKTGALVTNLYSYFGKSYRNLKCQVEIVINTNNSNPSRFTIYLYDSERDSFCIPAISVRCIGNPNLTFYRTSTNFTQGYMRKGNGTRYLDTGSATIYEVYATYISGTPAWVHSTQYSGSRNHRNFRYTTYNSLSDNKNNSGGCVRLQCVYAFLVQDIVKNGYGRANNIKCLLYKHKSEKGPFGIPVIDKISKTNTEPTDPYITGKFFYDTSIWGINVKTGAKAWTYYKA